ncbi:hypothetical protein KM043_004954 [Ampulex compressa]|nr:hypothetical protein KM043_004954 [Ampulex compressa]
MPRMQRLARYRRESVRESVRETKEISVRRTVRTPFESDGGCEAQNDESITDATFENVTRTSPMGNYGSFHFQRSPPFFAVWIEGIYMVLLDPLCAGANDVGQPRPRLSVYATTPRKKKGVARDREVVRATEAETAGESADRIRGIVSYDVAKLWYELENAAVNVIETVEMSIVRETGEYAGKYAFT